MRFVRLVLPAVLVLVTGTHAANLIPNGDFSLGNTQFGSDYAFSVYAPCNNTTEDQYTIGTNPVTWNCSGLAVSVGDHTSGSGNMLIANGHNTALGVWYTTTPIPVTPNTTYFFEAWILNWSTTSVGPNVAQLTFRANGMDIATASATGVGTWTPVSTMWNSGPNTTASLELFNSTPTTLGNDFAVDDISFDVTSSIPCAAPASGCRSAERSLLLIKDNSLDDRKDKLIWRWIKGQLTDQAEFGDPINSTEYTLCLYAGSAAGAFVGVTVPADSGKWREIPGKGYKYKDRAGLAAGVQRIVLKGSTENKSKVFVRGKGIGLPDPMLGSLPSPVTAQLTNSETPVCFEAIYDAGEVIKNETGQFRAKGQ